MTQWQVLPSPRRVQPSHHATGVVTKNRIAITVFHRHSNVAALLTHVVITSCNIITNSAYINSKADVIDCTDTFHTACFSVARSSIYSGSITDITVCFDFLASISSNNVIGVASNHYLDVCSNHGTCFSHSNIVDGSYVFCNVGRVAVCPLASATTCITIILNYAAHTSCQGQPCIGVAI